MEATKLIAAIAKAERERKIVQNAPLNAVLKAKLLAEIDAYLASLCVADAGTPGKSSKS